MGLNYLIIIAITARIPNITPTMISSIIHVQNSANNNKPIVTLKIVVEGVIIVYKTIQNIKKPKPTVSFAFTLVSDIFTFHYLVFLPRSTSNIGAIRQYKTCRCII